MAVKSKTVKVLF